MAWDRPSITVAGSGRADAVTTGWRAKRSTADPRRTTAAPEIVTRVSWGVPADTFVAVD